MTGAHFGGIDRALLLQAIKGDDLPVFKELLGGKDVNVADSFGNTYLHIAALYNAPLIVSFLIVAGLDINARDQIGATPLHIAALNSMPSAMAALLSGGAKPDVMDKDGHTALHLAVRSPDCVRLLLAADADPSAPRVVDGKTVLHLALLRGPMETMKLLLDGGAQIDTTDIGGKTPLHLAAEQGYSNETSFLLGRGADFEATDALGRTPLFAAIQGEYFKVVRYLLDHGADVLHRDKNGVNPLQVALAKKAESGSLRLSFENRSKDAALVAEIVAEAAEKILKQQDKRRAQERGRLNMELMERLFPSRKQR